MKKKLLIITLWAIACKILAPLAGERDENDQFYSSFVALRNIKVMREQDRDLPKFRREDFPNGLSLEVILCGSVLRLGILCEICDRGPFHPAKEKKPIAFQNIDLVLSLLKEEEMLSLIEISQLWVVINSKDAPQDRKNPAFEELFPKCARFGIPMHKLVFKFFATSKKVEELIDTHDLKRLLWSESIEPQMGQTKFRLGGSRVSFCVMARLLDENLHPDDHNKFLENLIAFIKNLKETKNQLLNELKINAKDIRDEIDRQEFEKEAMPMRYNLLPYAIDFISQGVGDVAHDVNDVKMSCIRHKNRLECKYHIRRIQFHTEEIASGRGDIQFHAEQINRHAQALGAHIPILL